MHFKDAVGWLVAAGFICISSKLDLSNGVELRQAPVTLCACHNAIAAAVGSCKEMKTLPPTATLSARAATAREGGRSTSSHIS